MKRLLLLLLPLLTFQCQPAHAQTSGQWRMSKRNANGTYTDYGVTLSNGQVIYLSSGIPAALTLNATAVGLGNVSNALQLVAANNLSDLVNAGTARTNLGLGTLATLSTITTSEISASSMSTGGNGLADANKLVRFSAGGEITATTGITVTDQSTAAQVNVRSDLIRWHVVGGFDGDLKADNITASRVWQMPDAGGTLALTTIVDSLNASNLSSGTVPAARMPALTGDVTTSSGAVATTLATVNSNVGSFTSANITVDAKGRITAASNGSSGLTIGTTTTSGAGSGDILTSNGTTLQKITPGTGVATALGNAVNVSSGLLTYSLIGTSGTKLPLLDGANTWSAAQTIGSSNILLSTNGTITLEGTGSLTLPTGSKFKFHPTLYGELYLANANAGLGIGPGSGGAKLWHSGGGYIGLGVGLVIGSDLFMNNPTRLNSVATGHLVIGASTAAQRFSVVNTWTSSTNHEVAVFDWQTTSNTLRVGSEVGSGGGTARDVKFVRGGVVKATIGANTTDHEQPVKFKVYAVGSLPAAATAGAYAVAAVSDAATPVVGLAVTGGGSAKALVCSNGTDWIVIATL